MFEEGNLTMDLKRTPLFDAHVKLNAKMVPFAGWEMPVQYSNVIEEHNATRTKVGLFDISHMGEIYISGIDALALLQKVMTNDLDKLDEGSAFYSAMCYENGYCVDDCFVYCIDKDEYMVVVNAGNIDKDFNWIKKHAFDLEVDFDNASDRIAKIDPQGPFAEKTVQKLTDENLKSIDRFKFIEIDVDGIKTIVSRTGYTGEDGFELYFDARHAEKMWNDLLASGKEFGIKPCGLGARDTLRVEACYSLYGHELDDTITPIEAGIGFAVKTDKEDFIGKNVLLDQKTQGPKRKIACFEMLERGIARNPYKVFNGKNEIGFVTSGTYAPFLMKNIGMALIESDQAVVDNEIYIQIRDNMVKAKIVKRPFYQFKGGK